MAKVINQTIKQHIEKPKCPVEIIGYCEKCGEMVRKSQSR